MYLYLYFEKAYDNGNDSPARKTVYKKDLVHRIDNLIKAYLPDSLNELFVGSGITHAPYIRKYTKELVVFRCCILNRDHLPKTVELYSRLIYISFWNVFIQCRELMERYEDIYEKYRDIDLSDVKNWIYGFSFDMHGYSIIEKTGDAMIQRLYDDGFCTTLCMWENIDEGIDFDDNKCGKNWILSSQKVEAISGKNGALNYNVLLDSIHLLDLKQKVIVFIQQIEHDKYDNIKFTKDFSDILEIIEDFSLSELYLSSQYEIEILLFIEAELEIHILPDNKGKLRTFGNDVFRYRVEMVERIG